MTLWDYLIFSGYLGAILCVGLAFSRRRESRTDFFVAGRSMAWFPIAASVTASVFSAINFTGFTGEVYEHGLYVLMAIPAFGIVAWPVARRIIPFFHARRPMSAYEYLETRFDRSVRQLAAALFIFWRVMWMAVALFATCRFLAQVTGLGLFTLILLAGTICTLYTTTGGMRAVMWTDVGQLILLFAALFIAVATSAVGSGGLIAMFERAAARAPLRPFRPFDPVILSPDPRVRMTVWSCLIGSTVAFLARYGVDQMVVQRYFTARSLADARRGFLVNLVFQVFVLLCLAFIGTAIRSTLGASGGATQPGISPIEALVRFLTDLPAGVIGIVTAGLFASTMASLDSGIHSCATSLSVDFFPAPPDAEHVSLTGKERLVNLLVGIAVIGLAFLVGRLGTIFEIANKIINGLGSPLLAICATSILGRGMTSRGVVVGGLLGTAASVWVSFGVRNLALHYYAVINLLTTLALCILASVCLPNRKPTSLHDTSGPWSGRAD